MKIGINRPNFFPWLGFMSLVDHVDTFILLDRIPISKGNFVMRNRYKASSGEALWLSQSRQKGSGQIYVADTLLAEGPWKEKLTARMQGAYVRAPFYREVSAVWEECITPDFDDVFSMNAHILECLCRALGITTTFVRASELVGDDYEDAELRVIDLCVAANGTSYYNARDGVEKGLYLPAHFADRNLELYKQCYTHPEYSQLHGEFVSHLCILDLMYNCGSESLNILRSGDAYQRCE